VNECKPLATVAAWCGSAPRRCTRRRAPASPRPGSTSRRRRSPPRTRCVHPRTPLFISLHTRAKTSAQVRYWTVLQKSLQCHPHTPSRPHSGVRGSDRRFPPPTLASPGASFTHPPPPPRHQPVTPEPKVQKSHHRYPIHGIHQSCINTGNLSTLWTHRTTA
jgi:hypothetical protein